MITTTDDNIIEILGDRNSYHFFYFTAPWCNPCKTLLPLVTELHTRNENENIKFYIVNIDDNDKLVGECNIKKVPSYAVIRDKKIIGIDGGADITRVGNLLKECLSG